MPNMRHCMFHNTVADLRDCEESDGMYDPESLSDAEQKARRRLIALCKTIAAEFEDDDE